MKSNIKNKRHCKNTIDKHCCQKEISSLFFTDKINKTMVQFKKVTFPIPRKTSNAAFDGGDILLDAYINDEQDTIYSIEVPCGGKDDFPRRSGYLQCNIDSDIR